MTPPRRVTLTGREYSKMARKRSTMVRTMSPMKRQRKRRHTINLMVLHGLVNQKKDVSGRLLAMEMFHKKTTATWKRRPKVFVRGLLLGKVQFRVHVGFIPAFSCRFCIHVILAENFQSHLYFALWTHNSSSGAWLSLFFFFKSILSILTPRVLCPSRSMEQGHQPLADFWVNRHLAASGLWGTSVSTSSIMDSVHFSGVFAGGIKLCKESSSVPGIQTTTVIEEWVSQPLNSVNLFVKSVRLSPR